MLIKPLDQELDDLDLLLTMLFCIAVGFVLGIPAYFEHHHSTEL